MKDTETKVTRKIGTNKNKARIWLEGMVLASQKWGKGTRFNAEFKNGEVVYTKDENGARKVAGTEERPIIDTNTDKLTDSLSKADKRAMKGSNVKVSATPTRIVITLASVAITISAPFLPKFSPQAKKVLIGCEFSGTVRDAFIEEGHDAVSCDLRETENPYGPHIVGDVREHFNDGWNLAIFHPPCTHLALSGARWATDHFVKCKNARPATHPTYDEVDGLKGYWHDGSKKRAQQQEALSFFADCLNAPIARVAVENPMSIASTQIRPKDQVIQPWQYGHGEKKTTWLWLNNLPHLTPTDIVEGREERVWGMFPSADREKERSRFFTGIAKAMVAQWGQLA